MATSLNRESTQRAHCNAVPLPGSIWPQCSAPLPDQSAQCLPLYKGTDSANHCTLPSRTQCAEYPGYRGPTCAYRHNIGMGALCADTIRDTTKAARQITPMCPSGWPAREPRFQLLNLARLQFDCLVHDLHVTERLIVVLSQKTHRATRTV